MPATTIVESPFSGLVTGLTLPEGIAMYHRLLQDLVGFAGLDDGYYFAGLNLIKLEGGWALIRENCGNEVVVFATAQANPTNVMRDVFKQMLEAELYHVARHEYDTGGLFTVRVTCENSSRAVQVGSAKGFINLASEEGRLKAKMARQLGLPIGDIAFTTELKLPSGVITIPPTGARKFVPAHSFRATINEDKYLWIVTGRAS